MCMFNYIKAQASYKFAIYMVLNICKLTNLLREVITKLKRQSFRADGPNKQIKYNFKSWGVV